MNGRLPFLTLPDPLISGEGAIDPLGLATIGDHLANYLLPGLRARMARPRFVTAIAVAAAVCDGLEDQISVDGMSPAHQVFEWLLVEAFVRECPPDAVMRTPGIQKAREVIQSKDSMCARTYLKTPGVFGFHGVYKPLAQYLRIVDDEMRLGDFGYELLDVWQVEQELSGFLSGTANGGGGRAIRQILRTAVEDGLTAGRTSRGPGWQGWRILAKHLAPSSIGRKEGTYIRRMFEDPEADPRGEVFRLLASVPIDPSDREYGVTQSVLVPGASEVLKSRIKCINAYEGACAVVEEAFDWIRYLSTNSIGQPISAEKYSKEPRTGQLARALPLAIAEVENAVAVGPSNVQHLFADLAAAFDGVRDAPTLFEAILVRHEQVQIAKPPEGKRSWFERGDSSSAMVRPPYRTHERPTGERGWNRPYRVDAALSFLADLKAPGDGQV